MSVQAPRDKLVCALNCCRVINNLLHVQVQGEARGVASSNVDLFAFRDALQPVHTSSVEHLDQSSNLPQLAIGRLMTSETVLQGLMTSCRC